MGKIQEYTTAAFITEGVFSSAVLKTDYKSFNKALEKNNLKTVEFIEKLMGYVETICDLSEDLMTPLVDHFDYSVSAPFGEWFVTEFCNSQTLPSYEECHLKLAELVLQNTGADGVWFVLFTQLQQLRYREKMLKDLASVINEDKEGGYFICAEAADIVLNAIKVSGL